MKTSKARILVVDDDLEIQDLLESYFKPRGYTMDGFSSSYEPLRRLEKSSSHYDLIVTDLKMPGMDGFEFISQVKKIAPKIPIILITGHSSVETAVKAIQIGAYDFVVKPVNCAQLNVSIDRGLRLRELETDNENLRREVRSSWSFEGVVGKSAAIQNVFDLARRVAKSTANVLITGESGTGKEVIARAIHHQSNRSNSPFVAINCSAIPENLLESELFGHAKGSFTGAVDKKLGLFEEADGGVLFLDEIGDMNLGLQTKLLRVLQERKIKRIGENQYRPIDVRVIAATHRDLKHEIQTKTFREDLFYRLCVIPIKIPPLRDRTEDIIPLAKHFLDKFKAQNECNIKGFTLTALEAMVKLPWKGNVRELENVVERAVVLCSNEYIDTFDLPDLDLPSAESRVEDVFTKMTNAEKLPTLEEFSQRYVEFVLKAVHGVKEKAARVLDIDRKTLYRRTLTMSDLGRAGSQSSQKILNLPVPMSISSAGANQMSL